jgi:hypothetical protein
MDGIKHSENERLNNKTIGHTKLLAQPIKNRAGIASGPADFEGSSLSNILSISSGFTSILLIIATDSTPGSHRGMLEVWLFVLKVV